MYFSLVLFPSFVSDLDYSIIVLPTDETGATYYPKITRPLGTVGRCTFDFIFTCLFMTFHILKMDFNCDDIFGRSKTRSPKKRHGVRRRRASGSLVDASGWNRHSSVPLLDPV